MWIPPALAGRAHDLTAARRHRITTTCVRLGTPVLADRAYQGAGGITAVPHRRKPGKDLTTGQRSVNRAHSRIRSPCRESHHPHQNLAHPPQSPDQPRQPHANRQ
ncbi:transposase family protein, partial [Streptomyces erythrochromogenes]|uniref:transposase family protein n=1 Tax=Streptomyces erythrochromogenes TaxID=285574 RepID=UPI0036BF470B